MAVIMCAQTNLMRTLVVDDSLNECALLEAELRWIKSIKLVGCLHNGVEAIIYLRGDGQFDDRELYPYPDLVLLDLSMPWCDGMEVLRYLHQQSRRPRVILWSNTLDNVDVSLALSLGADLVCRKPVNKRELIQIIDRLEEKVSATATSLLEAASA